MKQFPQQPKPIQNQPLRITIDVNPAGKIQVNCNQRISQLDLLNVLTVLITDNVASMSRAASMIINPNAQAQPSTSVVDPSGEPAKPNGGGDNGETS